MIAAIRTPALSMLVLGALALAGCNSKDDTIVAEDASVAEVAEQVAKVAVAPKPGRWEASMKFSNFEMTGVPPQVQEMMKQQQGTEQKWLYCLTPEDIEANNGEFFKPEGNEGCKYNTFKMGGGKIEADMTCTQAGPAQNMKMSGTYSSEAYDMQMVIEGGTQGSKVSMTSAVSGKRVGECDGTEPS